MYYNPITNFRDNNGDDLGKKLITKDYLISVYPNLAPQIGITPELWVWGSGNDGELGNSLNALTTSTPVTTASGGTNWKQVSGGDGFSSAIKTDGTLWTWGSNGYGQLGNATLISTNTPVTTFLGGTNWKQLSCGDGIMGAIKTDGTLWMWGAAGIVGGALGNGATAGNISTPVTTFLGGNNWKQLSCGSFLTSAIKTDGTLWLWGSGTSGVLGNATTVSRSTPVTTFLGGTNWKQVSSGETHTAAIKTDGTLWTWGAGGNGRLGNGATTGSISTPVTTFLGGTNWKQVVAGGTYSAAIKTDGTLWCWGGGLSGQLGNAVLANRSTPVTTFLGGTNWKQVEGTFNINIGTYLSAIKTDGTLWTWGNGVSGVLGNATTLNRSTPVTTFLGGNNWKQVACGYDQVLAIKSADFI